MDSKRTGKDSTVLREKRDVTIENQIISKRCERQWSVNEMLKYTLGKKVREIGKKKVIKIGGKNARK